MAKKAKRKPTPAQVAYYNRNKTPGAKKKYPGRLNMGKKKTSVKKSATRVTRKGKYPKYEGITFLTASITDDGAGDKFITLSEAHGTVLRGRISDSLINKLIRDGIKVLPVL